MGKKVLSFLIKAVKLIFRHIVAVIKSFLMSVLFFVCALIITGAMFICSLAASLFLPSAMIDVFENLKINLFKDKNN